jgi:ubiquinone/menaquinone biosynthesis C-methylase UbiE
MNWYNSWLYTKLVTKFVLSKRCQNPKERDELAHWIGEALHKKDNNHFSYFYTEEFGFDFDFFTNKRLLDIGCGPSGSLEWATGAKERIGIDPLAKEYLWLGAWKHKMKYLAVGSEKMPFPDQYFDMIFSFNSLDHVDDLDASCNEISRVLRPGGYFLLITDCNHAATITEPTFVPKNLANAHFADLEIVIQEYFKHTMLRTYDSLLKQREKLDMPLEDSSFILKLKLRKKSH